MTGGRSKLLEVSREGFRRVVTILFRLESASRCYRHSLDAGSDADLTISAQDDWLLMALKRARQEERRRVSNE